MLMEREPELYRQPFRNLYAQWDSIQNLRVYGHVCGIKDPKKIAAMWDSVSN